MIGIDLKNNNLEILTQVIGSVYHEIYLKVPFMELEITLEGGKYANLKASVLNFCEKLKISYVIKNINKLFLLMNTKIILYIYQIM